MESSSQRRQRLGRLRTARARASGTELQREHRREVHRSRMRVIRQGESEARHSRRLANLAEERALNVLINLSYLLNCMHLSSSPKHNLILSYTLASREALCVHTTYALVINKVEALMFTDLRAKALMRFHHSITEVWSKQFIL